MSDDYNPMTATFKSDRHVFNDKHAQFLDMLLGTIALNIETHIKIGHIPVLTGALKASVRTYRPESNIFPAPYRVEVNKVYASYQELGARIDGSRAVENYSTAGTGPGWFKDAINAQIENAPNIVNETAKAVGL